MSEMSVLIGMGGLLMYYAERRRADKIRQSAPSLSIYLSVLHGLEMLALRELIDTPAVSHH